MATKHFLTTVAAANPAVGTPDKTEKYFSITRGEHLLKNDNVRDFIEQHARVMQPNNIHICDGSDSENKSLLQLMLQKGMIKKLPKYENCWYARTDPQDVARVESKTVIVTEKEKDTKPTPLPGVKGLLNNWMSPEDFRAHLKDRFPKCMEGKTMYVIPFSMGPVGSPLAKIGIQLTDSPYVVASMRIMTRIGEKVLQVLGDTSDDYVRCVHSVGAPAEGVRQPHWPCDPARVLVGHIPANNEIISYGSGYGGNSLLGKKCFALRIASCLAQKEGWFAEHMLIMGVTNPEGKKRYMAAAFPSACGKTNLAMMKPSLPGWKVECVGDDIAWMRFDRNGQLRAINPEAGFFGVAPGTSMSTNPFAMETVAKNTVFTNVAETSDGGVWWEGMDVEVPDDVAVTDWRGKPFKIGITSGFAAHANSRFCAPASQCPIMDADWESPQGVPIDAIIFGGRRPQGIPLVYESRDWSHGVFMGASMRSEATAAAEHKKKVIMHDPFAMRPFFGYNFGHYLQHWLDFGDESKRGQLKLPKIFHVNWFRKNSSGKFIWPGFGENARVIDWIFRRCDGDAHIFNETPIGKVPKCDSIRLDGLKEDVDMKELLSISKAFWEKETEEIEVYLKEQVNEDLPPEISSQLEQLKKRINDM